MKKIHIISGGTIQHIAPHLALSAPAYGKAGRSLSYLCREIAPLLETTLHLTKMAGGAYLETNEDVSELLDGLIADPDTKIIFMPVALCDFKPAEVYRWEDEYCGWSCLREESPEKTRPRLHSNEDYRIEIERADKIIRKIRKTRKDIFLVGFKTTSGASEQEQYVAGLGLIKGASCNLVLANDIRTRVNMIITPEEAKYHVTADRQEALRNLVEMAKMRSHLTFTRSTVVAGEPVPWNSELVPEALRTVVNHMVKRGAYKPFRGATVGHFACKISDNDFLTSRRKTNFNDIDKLGLVRIKTDGPDTVLAYGSKPSVGGQSQRIVFSEHPEYDCIVHAHVPLKPRGKRSMEARVATLAGHGDDFEIPVVSQREYECGSHQCGQNTSTGLKRFGNLSAVYLDQHGPNVVFHHSIDPQEVIDFIEANFDLEGKTGGPV